MKLTTQEKKTLSRYEYTNEDFDIIEKKHKICNYNNRLQ